MNHFYQELKLEKTILTHVITFKALINKSNKNFLN
jgi:hypothetical protein